jgi:hypothetical protein
MQASPRPIRSLAAVAVLGGLIAISANAAPPPALTAVAGGLWEVSRSATGDHAVRQCVADPSALAQWEHRGSACTRVVLSDQPGKLVIHYTCPAGDFGRSTLAVITPRTLRIQTQGIHRGDPFFYDLHARRVGACPVH